MVGWKTSACGAAVLMLAAAVSTLAALNARRTAETASSVASPPARAWSRCPYGIATGTERVDVGSGDEEAVTPVLRASMSADGRFVAFSSASATLVADDRNEVADVFVRDLRTQLTRRVSVSSGGLEGDGASFYPAISADGRVVAFRSYARNLIKGDRNRVEDVFVHDLLTRTTARVSVGDRGQEANAPSVTSSINEDGTVVAFSSSASNLVRGDRNRVMDVFVRDRTRGRTIRVTVGPAGREANGASEGSGISRDGRVVVFRSLATNLIRVDSNGYPDVFVRDWVSRTTERVNVSSAGAEANHETYRGSISGNGRRVVFRSDASNLVAHDTNRAQDVFVHDRLTNQTTRISVSTSGAQAYAPPSRRTAPGHRFMSRGLLSRSGRYAVFGSYAANLVGGDTNRAADVFRHDLATRRTVRVSVGAHGAQADGDSFVMGVGEDGSEVLFASAADNLVGRDTNGVRDAFVRMLAPCGRGPSGE